MSGEKCLLCPTKKVAEHCRAFLLDRSSSTSSPPLPVRLIEYLICPEDKPADPASSADCGCTPAPTPKNGTGTEAPRCAVLHIVLFPEEAGAPLAKQFWQHTGMGISSRLAEYCLSMLADESFSSSSSAAARAPSPQAARPPTKGGNKHYSSRGGSISSLLRTKNPFAVVLGVVDAEEDLRVEQSIYLEERYGRNLPIHAAAAAKIALRRRIAGVLVRDNGSPPPSPPLEGARKAGEDLGVGPSTRGVRDVSEEDVFLFPTGMTAIWYAHHLAGKTRPAAKSVCFGCVLGFSRVWEEGEADFIIGSHTPTRSKY